MSGVDGGTRLGYRPELDGLRGIAVSLVVVGHAMHERVPLIASYAVEMFFVLSGFLITSLLLEEQAATGTVNLGRFYVRRARRLLPALVVLLGVVGGWALLVGSDTAAAGVVGGATYSSNWMWISGVDPYPLHHLWSLAVEEHFYLLWPLAVVVMGSTRGVLRVALVGAVVSLLWRWYLLHAITMDAAGHYRVGIGTDTRASALLAGAALAAAWRLGWRIDGRRAGTLILAVVLVASPERLQWGYLACTVATCLLIIGAVTHGVRWLRWQPLAWLGTISYALYLWHAPIMWWAGDRWPAVTVAASILVAWLSTRYVESRWKPRPSPSGTLTDSLRGSSVR